MRVEQLNRESTKETIHVEIHQVRFSVKEIQAFLEKLRILGKKRNCCFICFDRNSVAGKRHVKAAIWFALRSFSTDSPISRSLEVESLLYAGGTRQTGLIRPFGIKVGDNECYLCIFPPVEGEKKILPEVMEFVDEENWEELGSERLQHLQELFGITQDEINITGIERITDLIIERVALLNINR